MKKLLGSVLQCSLCEKQLLHNPRPILAFHTNSKILIIGQAPGKKTHESGIPWNDKSGEQLRRWLGVDTTEFYNPRNFAILPMSFCYPGRGKSGDLPPLPGCAPKWHRNITAKLKNIQLIILAGSYAQKYYLGKDARATLTDTVRHYSDYLPDYFPIIHPSPRNGIWQKKHPWFMKEVVPQLQNKVSEILGKNE